MSDSAFSITFDSPQRPPPPEDEGRDAAWATIRIGDFKESSLIATNYWSEYDYLIQWRSACCRVLDRNRPAEFLVDVWADWSRMNVSLAWIIYPNSDVLFVQNHILFPEKFPDADFASAHDAIHARETTSDDGTPVSEWRTSRPALASFALDLDAKLADAR